MLYHARALADQGSEVHLVGLEGTRLPRQVTEAPKSPCIGWNRRSHVIDITPPSHTPAWPPATRSAWHSACGGGCGPCRSRIWCSSRIRRRSRRFGHLVVAPHRRGVRFVIDWHNLGYSLLQLRLGRLASGGAHRAVVRAPRRAAGRREPLRLARHGGISPEPLRRRRMRSVLYDRPASAFVPMDRPARERFGRRCSRRLGVHRRTDRFCRVSFELDRRRGLRRRHRRRCAARRADPRLGSAPEPRRRFPESGHSRDGRRAAPRRVRAAVCRPAGAPDSSAGALARARRLPARCRQRRRRACASTAPHPGWIFR